MKTNIKMLITLIIISVVALVGCTQSTTPETNNPVQTPQTGTYEEVTFEGFDTQETPTKQFSSEEELLDFLKLHEGGSGGYYPLFRGDVMEETMAVADNAATSAPSPSVVKQGEGGVDVDYSETNVQVEGIDEADIIKTDGEYIYTITGTTLFIIKAYPGEEAEVISTIEFDDHPSGLFIYEDKLAVFGTAWYPDILRDLDIRSQTSMTFYHTYDITDRTNPEMKEQYWFEGSYFEARLKGEYLYLLTQSTPQYRVDFPAPLIIEDDVARSVAVSDIYYFPVPYDQPQFVTVHAIDMTDDSMTEKTITVEGSRTAYMSHDNLFLAYTQYVNEWKLRQEITMDLLEGELTNEEKELIQKIKDTDNDVLSQAEKEQKIFQIYSNVINYLPREEQEKFYDDVEKALADRLKEFEYMEYTVLTRVSLDKDSITPESTGKIPGHLNNQFALDERDGVLRAATTINARWDRFGKEQTQSTNNVFTLDSNLEIIDSLMGLAETETIYATRFMGDKLYMVTFRQVDPFFVIDLSNPNSIEELGELKIPGFSRYLHPYDESTIIGIGQDATEEGRTTGLKISLFDVSDVANPKEVASYVTEERYASSTALYEHKAFLFSREKNLLVIPAYSYSYDERGEGYNGAFVFDISKDEIELKGLIDHSSGERYWSPSVERSLYIEELLYTKSRNLLRINEIDNLESVKDIALKESAKTPDGIPIY